MDTEDVGFPDSSVGKESACSSGDLVRLLGWEDPLEKRQATHSSILGLPLWLSWLRICLQCRRLGFSPWVGKIPWIRERLPPPVFWPREFNGLHSQWGRKESDTTEQLPLSEYIYNEILFFHQKRVKSCHLQHHRWTLRALCQVKSVRER